LDEKLKEREKKLEEGIEEIEKMKEEFENAKVSLTLKLEREKEVTLLECVFSNSSEL
jgi:hypothetical protein